MKSSTLMGRLALMMVVVMASAIALSVCSGSIETQEDATYAPDCLVLVNKDHPISADYVDTIELVAVETVYGDECKVEKMAYSAYLDLKEALEEENVVIGVDSAYRSVEEQQRIMDEFTEQYGEEYAGATVAQPGTSEHQTGLAIDIVPMVSGIWVTENEDMLKETDTFAIIHETLPKYGFILRYMEGKEDMTGYSYEPWHIRYVGVEAAQKIYDRQVTLEEYLGSPAA